MPCGVLLGQEGTGDLKLVLLVPSTHLGPVFIQSVQSIQSILGRARLTGSPPPPSVNPSAWFLKAKSTG